jgi:hypothetical protein
MPTKPTLSEQILAILPTKKSLSPGEIVALVNTKERVTPVLLKLIEEGKIKKTKLCKYSKVAPKTKTVTKKAPKSVKKETVKAVADTEASVKAELDAAIQTGNTALIGQLLVQVFDGFIHEKSADFFQLRYMANWCRTKTLSGAYISKAYCLLVGSFMPFVLKLRNGDIDVDTEKQFVVAFTKDDGTPMITTVKAICPSRAIVEVRKSQRNGFHLERVTEAQS